MDATSQTCRHCMNDVSGTMVWFKSQETLHDHIAIEHKPLTWSEARCRTCSLLCPNMAKLHTHIEDKHTAVHVVWNTIYRRIQHGVL